MTKLTQWLIFLSVFASVWIAFFLPIEALADSDPVVQDLVFWSPLLFVVAFGVISVVIILYRVATFNDCHDASEELKRQIGEARDDLRSKGMKI